MLAIISCFCFAQCRKNKEPELPPVTTTGAMTFGCKINGKVFVPRDGRGRPGLYCQYVNLGNGPGGGWFLNIPATDWRSSYPILSVHIETDSLLLIEQTSYSLGNSKGKALAFYNADNTYFAKEGEGNLFIMKHDTRNRILSGTFAFTGTSRGKQVEVTEGRFDIRY